MLGGKGVTPSKSSPAASRPPTRAPSRPLHNTHVTQANNHPTKMERTFAPPDWLRPCSTVAVALSDDARADEQKTVGVGVGVVVVVVEVVPVCCFVAATFTHRQNTSQSPRHTTGLNQSRAQKRPGNGERGKREKNNRNCVKNRSNENARSIIDRKELSLLFFLRIVKPTKKSHVPTDSFTAENGIPH